MNPQTWFALIAAACSALLFAGKTMEQISDLKTRVKDLEAVKQGHQDDLANLRADVRVLVGTIEHLTKTVEGLASALNAGCPVR